MTAHKTKLFLGIVSLGLVAVLAACSDGLRPYFFSANIDVKQCARNVVLVPQGGTAKFTTEDAKRAVRLEAIEKCGTKAIGNTDSNWRTSVEQCKTMTPNTIVQASWHTIVPFENEVGRAGCQDVIDIARKRGLLSQGGEDTLLRDMRAAYFLKLERVDAETANLRSEVERTNSLNSKLALLERLLDMGFIDNSPNRKDRQKEANGIIKQLIREGSQDAVMERLASLERRYPWFGSQGSRVIHHEFLTAYAQLAHFGNNAEASSKYIQGALWHRRTFGTHYTVEEIESLERYYELASRARDEISVEGLKPYHAEMSGLIALARKERRAEAVFREIERAEKSRAALAWLGNALSGSNGSSSSSNSVQNAYAEIEALKQRRKKDCEFNRDQQLVWGSGEAKENAVVQSIFGGC